MLLVDLLNCQASQMCIIAKKRVSLLRHTSVDRQPFITCNLISFVKKRQISRPVKLILRCETWSDILPILEMKGIIDAPLWTNSSWYYVCYDLHYLYIAFMRTGGPIAVKLYSLLVLIGFRLSIAVHSLNTSTSASCCLWNEMLRKSLPNEKSVKYSFSVPKRTYILWN